MHGFEIQSGSPHALWVPVTCADGSFDTLYIGQMVKSGKDGVLPLGSASGAADTTGKAVPAGVVIGTNLRTPVYSSTALSDSITSKSPHDNTTEYILQEGEGVSKGDRSATVNIAVITPNTILKGRIFNAAYGTAPTVGTVSTGSTSGAGFTTSTIQPGTPVDSLCSVYFRTGLNRGIARITTDASATIKTVDHYFPFDIVAGDTVVGVPMRTFGLSYVQTDAEATYLNSAANPATDYWVVNILWLDLKTAGQECAYFMFSGDHFCLKRE